jgi:lambda family phage portal protein
MKLLGKYHIGEIAELVREEKLAIEREHAGITVRLEAIQRDQLREIQSQTETKIRVAMDEAYREGERRGFSIARKDRFTQTINDIDMPLHDVYAAISPGRNIARGLEVNNAYGSRALESSINNVVGPNGFTLQMDVRNDDDTPDEMANKFLHGKFTDFAKPENASVSGDMSFRDIQQFHYRAKRRDGEALCREHPTGKYGIQLQPLDPELLDETYTADLQNGNVVIMGVELDKMWRRQAYWLRGTRTLSGLGLYALGVERERVPANEMYHLFRRRYMRQTRGVTEFSPIALNMKGLMIWLTSSTENAISGAKLFAVMQDRSQQGTAPYAGQTDKAGNKPVDGSKIMRLDGVSIPELPLGKELNSFEPKFPHEQHDMFVKSMLRGMAVGWGTAYSTLSGDYSEANYSSERANQIDLNSVYRNEQEDIKESLLNVFFPRWLKSATIAGQFQLPSGKMLPVFSKFEKFNAGTWVGYRRPFVDPVKDAMAAILQIDAGLNSATQVVAENGGNILDVYNDLADETLARLKKGVLLKSDIEKMLAFAKDPTKPNGERQATAREIMMNYLKILVADREGRTKQETAAVEEEAVLEAAKKLINANGVH